MCKLVGHEIWSVCQNVFTKGLIYTFLFLIMKEMSRNGVVS